MDFAAFDKKVDLDGLKKDVEESKNDERTFEEVPHGTYEVNVNKMECTVTKKAPERPMLSIWFKIVSGGYKGQLLFYNQVLEQGFQIHLANELLRSLVDGEMEIAFESFAQYNDLVLDVDEFVADKFEYALNYSEQKGYPRYEITDVFEVS